MFGVELDEYKRGTWEINEKKQVSLLFENKEFDEVV